jgi:ribonucleoside-diphosphate reductase alpha subunit
MKVLKRDGSVEEMLFDKVTSRIRKLRQGLDVAPDRVAQKVFSNMYDGIHTSEIDALSADVAIDLMTENPDYETLATRLTVSNMHKTSPNCFSDCALALHAKGLVSIEFMKNITLNLDGVINHDHDYSYGFFGLKTLQRSYLLPGETPQYMLMRVALGIHGGDFERVKESYKLMSAKYFTHATPTLFNAGTQRPQMSSCFLVAMKDDSIEGIYDTLKECAQISKWSGGIGIHCSNVRARGTPIKGTNGVADGLIPMLRVFNNTARYVNQGGGKRKGSFAVYLEPWHADILEFLDLRLNQGDEESRCRDLFTALWISDSFMKAVEKDHDWWLMCPHECPGLQDVYGGAFEELYAKYVLQGKFRKVLKARQIWDAILRSQIETGTPYMCYKDSVNAKSNQKNIGTIKSSNLCTEIMEVSGPDETAVCNLASISLPAFVKSSGDYDYNKLHEVTRVITRNLNRVIDRNYYPTEAARKSNLRHRPIAIGVQGLADVYMMLGLTFDEPHARQLNKAIFEIIYHAALTESCELAKEEGPYETYEGSPASQGILQLDMWGAEPSMYNWNALKDKIEVCGLRNSLLVAPMPTASTAQILGNNEAFEPYTTNLYLRRTLAGEFVMINKHLVRDLQKLGVWTKGVKDQIIAANGSVQDLPGLPARLKEIYRTSWEISQKSILDMAADRGAFIDQSQSLNIFMESPTTAKLSSMHMYGWKKGLKTGMYYLRTRSKAQPIKFTIDPAVEQARLTCSRENPEACVMCSG